MTTEEYQKLLSYIDKIGEAEIEIDNRDLYENYYNVTFDDGYDIIGISAYHLDLIMEDSLADSGLRIITRKKFNS